MKTAILTISTSVAAGPPRISRALSLAEQATAAGREDGRPGVLPTTGRRSRRAAAAQRRRGDATDLHDRRDRPHADDVTPEATRAVIDRDAPGFAEAMRAESLRHTPMGILTRGVSGIAGRTLIINFPGNPKAIGELFRVIAPTLRHVVGTLQRGTGLDQAARAAPSTTAVPTPAIELRGLTRHFGERTALRDVSVEVPEGATLAVLGRNGAGKSTLLRILATLLRQTRARSRCSASRCRGGRSRSARGLGCSPTSRCCIAS